MYLKKLGAEIVFLQETHLTDSEHKKFKREWVGQVFASSFNSKSRGTAILINKNIPFTVTKSVLDPSGRYVMIQGHMYSEQWTMLNIYAITPNIDDHLFIQNVFLQIAQSSGSLLVGGDFNFCLDNVLNRSSTGPLPLSKAAQSTTAFMKDLNLTDVWRHEHPQDRDYSFYSHPHDTHTRIDYFLLSTQLLYCVMSLSIPPKIGRTYRWRLDNWNSKNLLENKSIFLRLQINLLVLTASYYGTL